MQHTSSANKRYCRNVEMGISKLGHSARFSKVPTFQHTANFGIELEYPSAC